MGLIRETSRALALLDSSIRSEAHIQQLLDGFLPDLLTANISYVDRDDFRRVLGKKQFWPRADVPAMGINVKNRDDNNFPIHPQPPAGLDPEEVYVDGGDSYPVGNVILEILPFCPKPKLKSRIENNKLRDWHRTHKGCAGQLHALELVAQRVRIPAEWENHSPLLFLGNVWSHGDRMFIPAVSCAGESHWFFKFVTLKSDERMEGSFFYWVRARL